MITLGEILAECINFEQLLLEGKDPVEILHYKFGAVIPEDIINGVINIDPTKKKSYSQWVLSQYKNESDLVKQSLSNGRLKQLFNYVKDNKEVQMKDLPSLSEALDNYVPQSDPIFSPSEDEKANDYEIVYDDANWRICVPNTYEASCKLGKDTRWCTANAYGNGIHYYNDYTSSGSLFVNFDKRDEQKLNGVTYPYTRYQFNFETNSFCDAYDSVVGSELYDVIPDEVLKFYEDEGYNTSNFESYEEKYYRYDEWRYEVGVRINDDLWLLPSFDDGMEIIENSTISYEIYDTNSDSRDSFSTDLYINCSPDDISKYILVSSNYFCIIGEETSSDLWGVIKNDEDYWDSFAIEAYLEYGDDYFYTSQKRNSNYLGVYYNGHGEIYETKCYELGDIFINTECASHLEYVEYAIEIHSNDGVQLWVFDENCEFTKIIRRDFPVEGEHYIANENGIIHGKYKSYNIDIYREADENNNFQVVEQVNDDVVVIEKGAKQNLYSISQKRIFGEENFKKFHNTAFGCYICISLEGNYFIMNSDGKRISNDYKFISATSKDVPLFLGYENSDRKPTTLIDPIKGEFLKVNFFNGTVGSNKQYYLITPFESNVNVLFDRRTNKIINNLGGSILKVTPYKNGLDENNSVVVINDENKILSIYDTDNNKILLDNIQYIKKITDLYDTQNVPFYIITFINGSQNIFNANSREILLSKGYDKIETVRNHDDEYLICILHNGNKLDYFDCYSKQVVLTTNQTDEVKVYEVSHGFINLFVENSALMIKYNIKDHKFYYRDSRIPIDEVPPIRQEEFNHILNTLGVINKNSIKESFNRLYNMIRLD